MPLLPPHPGPLPQILRVAYKALETVFREVFGGEGAKMRNFKTGASRLVYSARPLVVESRVRRVFTEKHI